MVTVEDSAVAHARSFFSAWGLLAAPSAQGVNPVDARNDETNEHAIHALAEVFRLAVEPTEGEALLRRAVGVVNDLQRLQGEIGAVLDGFAAHRSGRVCPRYPDWRRCGLAEGHRGPCGAVGGAHAIMVLGDGTDCRVQFGPRSPADPKVMLLGSVVSVDLDHPTGVSFLVRVPASEERARAVASLMLGGQRVEVTLPDTLSGSAGER